MNLQKRHLELLRKRYRLPISLLTHQTPQGSVLADAGFVKREGRIAGLITCYNDIEELHSMCISSGVRKLTIRYADYISLECLSRSQLLVGALEEDNIKVRVVNPELAREKATSLDVLEDLLSSLKDTIDQLEDEGTPKKILDNLSHRFIHPHSNARKGMDSALRLMDGFLDRVLLLELGPDASPQARTEGLWLLRHRRCDDYNWANNAADDQVCKERFEALIRDLDVSVIVGDTPIAQDLFQARCNLLGASGRFHLESKLEEMLYHICKAMRKYSREVITGDEAVKVLKAQKEVIYNLINRRSLIGSYHICLDDSEPHSDPVNEIDYSDASLDGGEEGKNDIHEDEEECIGDNEGNMTEEEDAMSCNNIHDRRGGCYVDSDNSADVAEKPSDGMIQSPGSSSSSSSSVNSPAVTEKIPQESPISSSSIVSSDSELGSVPSQLFQELELAEEEKDEGAVKVAAVLAQANGSAGSDLEKE